MPDVIVSDNGPQFTSSEFQAFLQANLIRHATSAPFHPSTNGMAERMVRITKDALKRLTYGDWHHRLADFLLSYRTTPSTSTGRSPAELRWGRQLTTRLDRLHPDRLPSSTSHPRAPRQLLVGAPVWARNYGPGHTWVPASVSRITGPLSYEVALDNGRVLRRHIDQLRSRRDFSDETPGSFPGGEGDPLEQREGQELLPISTEGATNGPSQDSAIAPKRKSWSLPTQQASTPTPARESPRGHTHVPHTSHSTPVTEDTRGHPNKSFPARELAHNPQSWPDLTPNPTEGQTYTELVEEPSPDYNNPSTNQGTPEFWESTETHTSPNTEWGSGNGQPPDRSWTDLGGSTETPSSGYHFKGPEGLQLVPGRCKAARDQTGCRQRRAHARVLAREK
ncbi:hypothetical protein NXF25_013148 [Crotalus adamanteus]|uniref:Integrase catalytic domain-containing protein n=1 Tax=Crotalus adamanteus TaxID=8729 RepID=A0AAW1BDR0_CROAD